MKTIRSVPRIKKKPKRYPLSSTPNWKYQLMAKIMERCQRNRPCEECCFWNEVRNRCIVSDITPDEWDIDLIAGLVHAEEERAKLEKKWAIRKAHI